MDLHLDNDRRPARSDVRLRVIGTLCVIGSLIGVVFYLWDIAYAQIAGMVPTPFGPADAPGARRTTYSIVFKIGAIGLVALDALLLRLGLGLLRRRGWSTRTTVCVSAGKIVLVLLMAIFQGFFERDLARAVTAQPPTALEQLGQTAYGVVVVAGLAIYVVIGSLTAVLALLSLPLRAIVVGSSSTASTER